MVYDDAKQQSRRSSASLHSSSSSSDLELLSLPADAVKSTSVESPGLSIRTRSLNSDTSTAIASPGNDSASLKSPQSRKRKRKKQSFAREMALQTIPMLFLSMIGSVLAGEVIARLKTWIVFQRVEELFILIPILLNLKGNIEMNLSARFSTSANIGELDIRTTRRALVLGNLALLQVQALLVSLLAGIVAFILGVLSRIGVTPTVDPTQNIVRGGYFECAMVLAASMLAASGSSAIVGAFMCALVIISRMARINPDNIATPLAASLGDLLSLVILGIVSDFMLRYINTGMSTVFIVLLLGAIAFNVVATIRNAYVQELIWSGWIPLLLALAVSSGTGLVLQEYVNEFKGFGLMGPVITGVAGNIGAIYVSRISTALHGSRQERHVLVSGTLFAISAPILMAFLVFVWITDQARIGVAFTLAWCVICALTLASGLLSAYFLAHWLWKHDLDPDTNALPLLSSIVDVIGQVLLVLAFIFARWLSPEWYTGPTDLAAEKTNGTAVEMFR